MTDALPDLTRLGIGKVLDELHGEFPKLSISKIRYLESEGLVEPQRTASGYRKFTFADVERLRFILRQQAAPNFWPLSHIRQVLDDMDRGTGARHGDGQGVTGSAPEPRRRRPAGRRDVQRDSQPAPALARGAAGVVRARCRPCSTPSRSSGSSQRRPTQTYYDGDDLQVAALVAEFAELGLEPRHLRHFGTQADREASLVEQIISPRARSLDQEAAEHAAAALAALSVRLHTVLVRNRVRG